MNIVNGMRIILHYFKESDMQYYLVKDVSHYCNVCLKKYGEIIRHTIPYYDFTFVLEGTMVYYANDQKIILQRNDAIFLPPGTVRAREDGKEQVHFVSFNFTALEGVDFPFSTHMQGCITQNIRKLIAQYPPSHLSSFYHAKEKCVNMLNYILYELLDAEAIKCDNEHVSKMLYYIEEHITENLRLQTISEKMNLSKEYTSYIFKKETGKTLTDYVNERKILLAREMIQTGEMSLTEIAGYLGFENYNYFSRLFKRYMETSPVVIKKNF